MDDVRVGRVVRALRRRLGWRQSDLALRAGVSQGLVSLLERGQLELVSIRHLRAVLRALDADGSIDVRWRGGELDRLLDRGHAALVAEVVRRLRQLGWETAIEVTYSIYGERGSIDVLAWRGLERALLVVEVKTEVASTEATARKHDEKFRLARDIAFDRFGWRASSVSRLLVLPESGTARRRLRAEPLASAYATRAQALRAWLGCPSGSVTGAGFLPLSKTLRPSRRIDVPRGAARAARDRPEHGGATTRGLRPRPS